MELKNDEQSYAVLDACVDRYYSDRNLPCLPYGVRQTRSSNIDGVIREEVCLQTYFVARKHFIQYAIAIDTRNFYSMLSLAIGPHFVNMRWLVSEENESKFSMESTTEAVVHNLAMLDEYLGGRLK